MSAAREAERFTAALDAHRMGPRLSAALSTTARPCHVLDAKYEPGIRAEVLYQHGPDLVRGDLLEDDADEARPRTADWPAVTLSVYPWDPDLPTLPLAVQAAEMGPRIASLGAAWPPEQRRAFSRRCRVDLLRYRSGKRATLRLHSPTASASYVAKVYHDPTKAAAVAHEAEALTRLSGHGDLRVAPTVGHFGDLAVVVQQSVAGRPLDALLRSGGPNGTAVEAVRLAASALAQLHRGPTISTRQRPVEKELHRFRARALRIHTVDARVGDQLLGVAERLLETASAFPVEHPGVVHGDCKPGQFLLAETGGTYLLDFDHCGVSDQAGDAGTFVASLRQLAVHQTVAGASPARAAAWHALAENFMSSYCAFRGENLCTRIRWHEIVALQRKALRAFARSPRSPLPTALAEESHRCLDRVTQELS